MQKTVAAPDGYEATACFNVDSKAWESFYRKAGGTWWTKCAVFGHGQMDDDEVASHAAEAVAAHILVHAKRPA